MSSRKRAPRKPPYRPTLPSPSGEPIELPSIPAGKAKVTATAAFLDVLSALARLEAVTMALARGLDIRSRQ